MLIIARNPHTAIIINRNIRIIYLGLNYNGQCRLGIEAPRDIRVYREEIQRKIDKELKQESDPYKIFTFCPD